MIETMTDRRHMARTEQGIFLCIVCLLYLAGVCSLDAAPRAVDGSGLDVKTIATGLKRPVGLSWNPKTEKWLVSEEGAGRVSMLSNGRASPVVTGNWTWTTNVPNWALSSEMPREKWTETILRKPGAISVSTNGHLVVAESVPHGRLIEFIPDDSGKLTLARPLPIPWLSRPFLWDDVKMASDGRLFIAGSDASTTFGLKFGSVLVRDQDDDWWVVDYGPFVDFSSIYLSKDHDIMVVAERSGKGLTWWDTYRHMPIGSATNLTLEADLVSVGLMPDGAFVIGQGASEKGNDALLKRIDPLTGEMKVLVEGFTSVGAMALDESDGSLYVTDPEAGTVVQITSRQPVEVDEYLLQRSHAGYEIARGYTPRQIPSFLRNFFSQVRSMTDARGSGTGEGEEGVEIGGSLDLDVSLKDFASRIPMVAGQVKTVDSDKYEVKDPVVLVDFVLLFPGRAVMTGEAATPSLCFFSARRKSGKVERTRPLFNSLFVSRKKSDEWSNEDGSASLFIPIASCAVNQEPDHISVSLIFLGLGIYDDYYLNLWSGIEDRGTMIVEGKDGTRTTYATTFEQTIEDIEEKTLLVAGFDPSSKGGIGWLNIGRFPVGRTIGYRDDVTSFSSMDDVVNKAIKKRETKVRFSSGVDVDQLSTTNNNVSPSVLTKPGDEDDEKNPLFE